MSTIAVHYIKQFSAFTISISGEIIITSFHTGTFLHQMNTDAKRAHTYKEQGLLFKQIFLTEILSHYSEHKWASIPVFFFPISKSIAKKTTNISMSTTMMQYQSGTR